MHSRWPRLEGLADGGTYDQEQWRDPVWAQDVALMRAAGVTLVSVRVFARGMPGPRPGDYEFGWLDRMPGLLHDAEIAVRPGHPNCRAARGGDRTARMNAHVRYLSRKDGQC